jgi:hypothetical protein
MRQNIIIFFLGVLLGLIPMYLENQRIKQEYRQSRATLESQAERAQTEFTEAKEKLRVALLRDQLSSLIWEAEHDNFGSARLQSTHFFNRVRDTLPDVETPAVRQALRRLLERRDEVTAALVSNDDRVATQLREVYEEFPRATTLTVPENRSGQEPRQAQAPMPSGELSKPQ